MAHEVLIRQILDHYQGMIPTVQTVPEIISWIKDLATDEEVFLREVNKGLNSRDVTRFTNLPVAISSIISKELPHLIPAGLSGRGSYPVTQDMIGELLDTIAVATGGLVEDMLYYPIMLKEHDYQNKTYNEVKRFIVHIILDWDKVLAAHEGKVVTPEFFTPTRERKYPQFCRVSDEAYWAALKNPQDFMVNASAWGCQIYPVKTPPIHAKNFEAQQKTLAASVVADDWLRVLNLVTKENLWLCAGVDKNHVDEQTVPILAEDLAFINPYLYAASREDQVTKLLHWRLASSDPSRGQSYPSQKIPEFLAINLQSVPPLNFTATKPEALKKAFEEQEFMYKYSMILQQMCSAQGQRLMELYKEHGTNFRKWLADKLIEEVSLNAMEYITCPDKGVSNLAKLIVSGG
jgi:hypothetical protein